MNPSEEPYTKWRTASGQVSNGPALQAFASEGSPSPQPSLLRQLPSSTEIQPQSKSQIVSVGLEEEEDSLAQRDYRLQIELACVETKTVTTTTTTKRSYPPLLVRHTPLDFSRLDAKEYPLAQKPTPADLLKFSFTVEDPISSTRENQNHEVWRLSNNTLD